jgi:hypothetical protein
MIDLYIATFLFVIGVPNILIGGKWSHVGWAMVSFSMFMFGVNIEVIGYGST